MAPKALPQLNLGPQLHPSRTQLLLLLLLLLCRLATSSDSSILLQLCQAELLHHECQLLLRLLQLNLLLLVLH